MQADKNYDYFREQEKKLCKHIIDFFYEVMEFAAARDLTPRRSSDRIMWEIMVIESWENKNWMDKS